MVRFLQSDEKLVLESPANYIGGHPKLDPEIAGTIVLTTKRFVFEAIAGSLRKKRPVILLDFRLGSINQAKIEKLGKLSKPTITIIVKVFENIEQPSFQVSDREAWEKAIASVRIGGLI